MRILALDASGHPNRWISKEDAITYHAKKLVAYELGGDGEHDVTFRGGQSRLLGSQSMITTAPIIAVKGTHSSAKRMKAPALTNSELFRRDRNLCAYCGKIFSALRLTRDHIVPTSRGGPDKWTNVVTACEGCNNKKDNKLLEECNMALLYVPYAPNWAESLILENRNILASQMDYLTAFLPAHSRVWEDIKAMAN